MSLWGEFSTGEPSITLSTSKASLSVSLEQGANTFEKIYVTSNSTQAVNVQATAASSLWLRLDGVQLNGSTVGSVYQGSQDDYYFWAFLDAAGLAPNAYSTEITITSPANIIKIPVTLTVTAPVSSPTPTPEIRVGQLVNKNSTMFLVGSAGLYAFPDLSVFNSWGFSFSQVVTANSAE
jgi:hypothetical protein